MSVYATQAFWAGTVERMIKVFASALLGAIGTGAAGVLDIDWPAAASVAAMAGIVSLLTSVAQPEFTSGVPRVPATDLQAQPPAPPQREYPDPPYNIS